MATVTQRPNVLGRIITAIEPWYNWGTVSIERMAGMRIVDGIVQSDAEGYARFLTLQWFGVHLEVQIGRLPKAVR